MPSRLAPPTWLRGPLARSFALRLAVAFALVALVGGTVTAVAVNTAFASRLRQYVDQQQNAQVTGITAAAASSYAGSQKWDLSGLQSLAAATGSGTVRILTSSGHDVWEWDGARMRWNDPWVDDHAEDDDPGGSGQGACGSWQHCESGGSGDDDTAGSSEDHHGGKPDAAAWRASGAATVRPAADVTPQPSDSTGPDGLGPAQRLPIVVGGTTVGTALVRLPEVNSLPEAVAFRTRVVHLVLIAAGAGALLSLALGTFFARRTTRPVRQVTTAARALAAGDRHARLDVRRADEFGEMSRAFNTMADAAEGAERLRQAFAAEVAHELRTPLTVLRSQVEGLQEGVLEPGPAALTSLDEEVQRMTRLVADLQILGAADAAGFSLQPAPVALDELVEQSVRDFAGLFQGAGIELHTRLEPVTAPLDRVRIGQVLANVLSNALKFTPAGGTVGVELITADGQAVVRVRDSGPGIPADELPHVFDRFFRGRTARAAGSGIGLAVVHELVAAHGGSTEVDSEPDHGAAFTVRLPLEATSPPNRFLTGPSQPPPSVKS
ncbi:sensor histidine kinase [Streptomyces dysideae]|uniref:histidine kinase n=1 Tax=Streptomyces dysideae TaxID=909626 RepID=A0A117RYH3_9ACTN|nr:HAMP domain-containing sensor histidine kinase [Streptomyces dysideae]KUO16232.1 hypothetical protein AQJ91_37060 [Streptomyces dysideae]